MFQLQIPIHEEDASNVVGETTEGGIEVDPERLPSTLMQLDILCSMAQEIIPEALGHNYPLFLA